MGAHKKSKGKKAARRKDGAVRKQPHLPSSMGTARRGVDKRIGRGRVRALDLVPKELGQGERLPRKTRDMLRVVNELSNPHKERVYGRDLGKVQSDGEDEEKKAADERERNVNARVQGIKQKESWKDFNQRITRETRAIVDEELKSSTSKAEKRKRFYEKKDAKLKERKRQKKRRKRRSGSDSESDEEFADNDNEQHENASKGHRIRHPMDHVAFGERVEAPPTFSALPKVRGRSGGATLSKRKGGAIATILARASQKSAELQG